MGVSNLGDLVATAQLDISPFIGNTRQLQLYLRGVDNALKTSENSVKGYSDKLSGLKQVYNQTGMALNGYKKLLDKQTATFNNIKKEVGDLNTAESEHKQKLVASQSAMMATASRVAELQNKYDALGREIASLSSRWLSFGNELSKSGEELTNIGIKASGVGKALTLGLTTPIVSGVGYITKLAIEYESAFAGVKKTVDETSTTSYEKLSKDFREMSKTLPATASDIARVAEVAGQLGIEADNITGFTKVMIDLGESTNLSATSAAESLAKFVNITKMAPENYGRLGASIVDLGNNFATTEEDIIAMATRLAGAGSQIGLSQADIVGLAGALSSVGIEAEMGGSSFSKLMVKMQLASTSGAKGMDELITKTGLSRREFELMLSNSPRDFKKLADSIGMTSTEMSNIVKASANLEDFARISGMTADEFVQKFEKDAVGAIGAFINGLGNAEESGESAIEMLTEMGFSEIRLRDSLLRAGNAQDLFSRAVGMSNNAWEKNTALTNEANKRYETTASKIKMLRNEAIDTAIEFGGPLVDALRESLDVARPWINSASEMAKAFNELDKEQQQQIIKWGLITAGIGPALTVFGKVTSVIGATHKGLGTIIKSINTVSTALKVGKPAVEALGVASATTAGSATGLAGAIGTLGSPYTWGVLLGGTALLAIGVIATEMGNARQRTLEWGTEVSEVEANHLSKLKAKVNETTQSMIAFSGSADGVDDVKTAFKGLVDEIERLQNKDLAKDLKLAEKYGLTDEQIQRMKDNASQVKENAQKMSDEVVQIYKNASESHRELSAEEKEIVLNNQTELINKQLELMNFSKDERKNIQKAMNGDYESLNTEQLSKALDTTKKWLSEENKAYKQSKAELKELLKAGGLTQQEYNDKLATLEAEHQAKMEAYGEKYMAIRKKMAEASTKYLSPEAEKAYWNVIEQEMDKLGLSYDELQTKIKGFADSAEQTSGMTAKSMANMTDEMTSANLAWNTMVLDPKTGEIKTNAQEEIQKALQAEGGWESMQFVLKNANLETNAKIAIGEALVANDQWNSLTPEEKRLVTDGSPAIEAIMSSKEALSQWNSMPEEVKKILGSNEQFLSSFDGAMNALNAWNMMTPTQKALTAQNLTGPDVTLAQQTVNSLTGKNVSLDARNNTLGNVLQANANVNSVRQNSPAPIYANNQTRDGVEGAKRSIAGVEGKTVDIWVNLKKGASTLWNAIGWATGTNYHPGGLAVVNDQKGSTYRELVTLPNGNSFIPEGRDVILPLPKGSKVLKASKTKQLFPRYADGIGFENTRIARLTERMRDIPEEKITATYQSDNSEVKRLLAQLLALTGKGTELMSQIVSGVNDIYDKDSYMVLDSGTLVAETGSKFAKHFASIERRNNRLRGKPYD